MGKQLNFVELPDVDEEEITATQMQKLYARYSDVKQKLKSDKKEVQSFLNDLEPRILDHMTENGIQNLKINGKTIYVHSQIWANKNGEWDEAADALKDAGLDDLLDEKFHSGRLSGWVREQVEQEYDNDLDAFLADMPDSFRQAINVTEKFSARVRSS